MVLQNSLAVLALIGAGSVSFAQEAWIGSTSIRLTSPQGQCEFRGKKEDEAHLAKVRELLLSSGNELLGAYADCTQLAQFRSGKREEFNDFAQYVAPRGVINVVLPSEFMGEFCAEFRTKTDRDFAAILQNRSQDMERLFQGMKIDEAKFLGVLAEEPSVCYGGYLHKISGVTQTAIFATILLKQKLITYQIYTAYRNRDTIFDLLNKHKLNVTKFIGANAK
jgi:hypothetical protein